VVSSDAFAAGGGSLPDPGTTDPDYPWLYWAAHDFVFNSAALDQQLGEGVSLRRSFDIRSMRKIKPRETLAVVVEYTDTIGAPPLTFSMAPTRVLVAT